jgi:hypothetical protein
MARVSGHENPSNCTDCRWRAVVRIAPRCRGGLPSEPALPVAGIPSETAGSPKDGGLA